MTIERAFVALGRWLSMAALAWLLLGSVSVRVVAQKQPEATTPASVAWKEIVEGSAEDYAGAETCRHCHKREFVDFDRTPHTTIHVPGKTFVEGCESCHGPGKAHVKAVEDAEGDVDKMKQLMKEHPIFAFRGSPPENAARCLICHTTSKMQAGFAHSEHLTHGVGCNDCHASHLVEWIEEPGRLGMSNPQAHAFQAPRLNEQSRWLQNSLLKASEPGLCYRCHTTIAAQFALPVHHRVSEGQIKCSDCHNAHGSPNRSNLRQAGSEVCTACHVEKHGPFVYEHAAIKEDGCLTCHTPHGSSNRMLLIRREGRQLCIQCHVGYHGQAQVPHSRKSFQTSGECTRCHVAIHGSNFDATLLQ